jgi:hypothetical protein
MLKLQIIMGSTRQPRNARAEGGPPPAAFRIRAAAAKK